MRLMNASGMAAGYTLGLDPSGAERLVVAVKGTFGIPRRGASGEPRLLEQQIQPVDADLFTGQPGRSATLVECDYPPAKPRCDVLLNGAAHAPGGRPAERVVVGLQFNSMQKAFTVWGERRWEVGPAGFASPGAPERFTRMPISYDNAFGGVDFWSADAADHRTYLPNPVGRGWHRIVQRELVHRTPMPSTEERGDPVQRPNGSYKPMAFGPIGRNWPDRVKLAGTYDQHWQDNVFPFLPADFDPAYFHCAPEDQRIDPPRGGEKIVLMNLTEDAKREFAFPAVEVPVVFFRRRGERVEALGVPDTVLLDPEAERFSVVWRASLLLERDIFEVVQVVVGCMSRAWWRSVELGKTYHPSLDRLVREKREQPAPEEVAE